MFKRSELRLKLFPRLTHRETTMEQKQNTKHLMRQIKHLKRELQCAQQFKDLYLSKWEKWEEIARALYQEVHGKEATL